MATAFEYAERFRRAHPELTYDHGKRRWFINGKVDDLGRVFWLAGEFLREQVPLNSRNRGKVSHRESVVRNAKLVDFQ